MFSVSHQSLKNMKETSSQEINQKTKWKCCFVIIPFQRVPVIVASETTVIRSFSILSVYMSLMFICSSKLSTRNTPALFFLRVVLPSRTFPLWSSHVTLGCGNHLSAIAIRVSLETLNMGAEKAWRNKIKKVNVRKPHKLTCRALQQGTRTNLGAVTTTLLKEKVELMTT